jgi:hypothetical protein
MRNPETLEPIPYFYLPNEETGPALISGPHKNVMIIIQPGMLN